MGNTVPPVNETSLPSPISPYGASKLACEGYISAYTNSYDFKSIIFRFGNVYGPYSSHKVGVINRFIRNGISGKECEIYGSINTTRDYIHVDDIINAIELGLEKIDGFRKNLELFHLANGLEVSLNDLIMEINKYTDSPLKLTQKDFRKGEVLNNYSSYEYAQNKLGFTPKVDLKNGIENLYKWINTNEY